MLAARGGVSLLEVRDLVVAYGARRRLFRPASAGVRAVDGVSFSVTAGTTFALVGESGCGKTTVARSVVGLIRPNAGSVQFDGDDLARVRGRGALLALRRRQQMVFQDPFSSLNPRWRTGAIIAEPLRIHGLRRGGAVGERVAQLLTQVGLSPDDAGRYPHGFSGGQRQRIAIARALASEPDFVVCDEPTSALDVSVQAQVLNLLKGLQQTLGLSYLFISHNLAVVASMADEVGVMYRGRLMEWGPARDVLREPQHPYTRMLLGSVPGRRQGAQSAPSAAEDVEPSPSGCPFAPRCPLVMAVCRSTVPPPVARGGGGMACFR